MIQKIDISLKLQYKVIIFCEHKSLSLVTSRMNVQINEFSNRCQVNEGLRSLGKVNYRINL